MSDDEFREMLVRNRPRAFVLALLLIALLAWLGDGGIVSW